MNNQEVAQTFSLLADRLDIEGKENRFAILAYRRAAEQIANLDRDINAIAHSPAMLNNMHYGVAMARRAWATADRVVNTWPLEKLLDYLKQNT
jgi:DNA polymerase (family 10)